MQPREHGFAAVWTADFDGVVFLSAVVGAEDMQTSGL